MRLADAPAAPVADRAQDRSRLRLLLLLLVAGVLVPLTLGSSTTIFNDGDVSWHIATGRWILEHGAIPASDPFSFTAAGQPWVPIEWLAEVAYAAAYAVGGYGGVAAVVGLALVALHLAVTLNAMRYVGAGVVAVLVIAMDVVLLPMMLARPHLLAWPLLAWWTWMLLRAREQDAAPPIWSVILLWLWTNIHGSFVLGLAIAAAFALEALLATADRARVVRQWGLFGSACLVAVLLNANGLEGVLHPFSITGLEMLPLIDEWKPSDPAVTPEFFGVLGVTAALAAWRGVRLHPVRAVLLVVLVAMALLQVRHQSVLAIVAAMLLPPAFAAARSRAPKPLFENRAQARLASGAAAAAVAVLLAMRLIQPLEPSESAANPNALIAAVPPELRAQPVLNGWTMGGPLILAGIRPYVDGRGDMYGDVLVLDYSKIVNGDAQRFREAVRRWDIRWTILPHESAELIALLDRSPDWKRLRETDAGVVHVRTTPQR